MKIQSTGNPTQNSLNFKIRQHSALNVTEISMFWQSQIGQPRGPKRNPQASNFFQYFVPHPPPYSIPFLVNLCGLGHGLGNCFSIFLNFCHYFFTVFTNFLQLFENILKSIEIIRKIFKIKRKKTKNV